MPPPPPSSVLLPWKVLSLYTRILRVGRTWKAANPNETIVERDYIVTEAKDLFR